MEEIRQAGFGDEEEFSIPRPLAYLPSLRLLLCEKVVGTRARSIIADPIAPDRIAAVERCARSEEHTSELQSHSDLVCRLLLEKKKKDDKYITIIHVQDQ